MIISCSRRTDIPAFYSDWFFNRLLTRDVTVRNPVNPKQVRRVSLAPEDVDCIVFWTKDPAPMLDRLALLKNHPYYFQFTLTPYGPDIEPNLSPKAKIIDTFLRLSDKIGAHKVIWRLDPILLSKKIGIDFHIKRFYEVARRLDGYTQQCVISFIDMYRHIQNKTAELSVRPPAEAEMQQLTGQLVRIAAAANMLMKTCAENIDLADLGIEHGQCIDTGLISELTGRACNIAKDPNQRKLCGCAASVDVGAYNTCGHQCTYCYANVSPNQIEQNRSRHNDQSPLLIGEIDGR